MQCKVHPKKMEVIFRFKIYACKNSEWLKFYIILDKIYMMKDKESFFSISIFTPYCFKKEFSENYFHSNKVLSSRQAIFIEITSMGWCVDYHALETKSHIITIYIQHKILANSRC